MISGFCFLIEVVKFANIPHILVTHTVTYKKRSPDKD